MSIVSATASDNVGVTGVQFQLDGANLGPPLTTTPYAISWTPTSAFNGPHTLTAVANDAAGNSTTSAGIAVTVNVSETTGPVTVVWTQQVNVIASGTTLTKTSGCDGCADAGAVSQQQILSGNGYLQFAVPAVGPLFFVGLSNGNPGTSGAATIPFAIRIQSDAEVWEGGVYRAGTLLVAGDVFKISIESGVVNYYRNGGLFYTSTRTPVYPLGADATVYTLRGAITNAVIKVGP